MYNNEQRETDASLILDMTPNQEYWDNNQYNEALMGIYYTY